MARVGHGSSPVDGSQVVSEARKFLGDPYVFGAEGPSSFDCSGLVEYVMGKLGVNAPRTSEDQFAWAKRIPGSQLKAGDLIFSQWPGDEASPGHVAIYAGNGKLIEAPEPGEDVHEIPFDSGYKSHVVGYGQAPGTTGSGAAGSGGSGGVGGALGGVASGISGLAGDFEGIGNILTWLTMPSNWVRIFAGIAGAGLLGAGVFFIMQEAR